MAFIPDSAIKKQRRELKASEWDVYCALCIIRNHKTQAATADTQRIQQEFPDLSAKTIHNAIYFLKVKKWIVQKDDSYVLLVGDFTPVDKKYVPQNGEVNNQEVPQNGEVEQEKFPKTGKSSRKSSPKRGSEFPKTGKEVPQNGEVHNKDIPATSIYQQESVTNVPDSVRAREGESSRPQKSKSAVALDVVLPDCISADDWQMWLDHRREINHPVTLQAAKQQIKFLSEANARGQPPGEIISQSVRNGWRGLFELKEENGNESTKRNGFGKDDTADAKQPSERVQRLKRSAERFGW